MERRASLFIEIRNITSSQAAEFLRLFSWMNKCGQWGASRGARISYDGDGNARARIVMNGEEIRTDGAIDDEAFSFE